MTKPALKRVLLIKPGLSGNRHSFYINTFKLEPLSLAVIAGCLPSDWEVELVDDSLEPIPFARDMTWVGISVETYTAKRAYAIATEYRNRGIPVVLGGYHPTLVPDEALQYADAIVSGEAENVVAEICADALAGKMKRIYRSEKPSQLEGIKPRRDLFQGKRYLPIHPVEFGRGCKYRCDFCSIQSFHQGAHRTRPVADVIEEIRSLPGRNVLFVDDNFVNNRQAMRELLHALIPLKIRWAGQATLDVARDEDLLDLCRKSGCVGFLIGLESLHDDNLAQICKGTRTKQYEEALSRLRRYGITVNGSFVFGYDADTPHSFDETLHFARRKKFFVAGFNHLMPYPGTPLYARLKSEGRLLYDKWWLEQEDYFGSVAFLPRHFTPDALALGRYRARRAFYSWPSILYRMFDLRTHLRSPMRLALYLMTNVGNRRRRLLREEAESLPSHLLSKTSPLHP